MNLSDLPDFGIMAILVIFNIFGKYPVAKEAEKISAYCLRIMGGALRRKFLVMPEGPGDFSLNDFRMLFIASSVIFGYIYLISVFYLGHIYVVMLFLKVY